MQRMLAIAGISLAAATTGFIEQQKSEVARAVIAALEHVKSTQTGPFLLSPLAEGPARASHDSALLSQVSSVALRVAPPAPPHVRDTFVLSFSTPQRLSEGVYSIRAGGYFASERSGRGCYIGGPSFSYAVRCTSTECKAEATRQSSGSGRCE